MSDAIQSTSEAKQQLIADLQSSAQESESRLRILKLNADQIAKQIAEEEQNLRSLKSEVSKLQGTTEKKVVEVKKKCLSFNDVPLVGIDAVFCNRHGIKLSSLDDYVLLILYNIETKYKSNYYAKATELQEFIGNGGLVWTGDFVEALAESLTRLVDEKYLKEKSLTYKLTARGSRFVEGLLGQTAIAEPEADVCEDWIIEALEVPGTFSEVVSRLVNTHSLGDAHPWELAKTINKILKSLLGSKIKLSSGSDDMTTIYELA